MYETPISKVGGGVTLPASWWVALSVAVDVNDAATAPVE